MTRAVAEDGLTKFQRYRRTQRRKGMKLLRVWVPDPTAPDFRAEASRQALLLRGAPEETDALGLIDSAMGWPPA